MAPTDYDPRYISVDDVPLEIADQYSTSEKREALFGAEHEMEIDLVGGEQIPEDEVTPLHQTAVANLATHYLTRGATSNDDITLGDLDDGGEQTERHADQYRETYERLIEKLAEAGPNGQSGTYLGKSPGKAGAVSVNTGKYSRRHNLGGPKHTELVHPRFRVDDE